jgi:ribonuclease BN (tRNA processing enzyme)
MDRRAFLTGAASLASTWAAAARAANAGQTKLILLGTGGGPRPRKASSGSAQVIVTNGVAYVIDCGDGVARQLVFAGVALDALRHVFITHHHSDHNADYGNLILLAWTAGLRTRVDTWGPVPLQRMTELFLRTMRCRRLAKLAPERRR